MHNRDHDQKRASEQYRASSPIRSTSTSVSEDTNFVDICVEGRLCPAREAPPERPVHDQVRVPTRSFQNQCAELAPRSKALLDRGGDKHGTSDTHVTLSARAEYRLHLVSFDMATSRAKRRKRSIHSQKTVAETQPETKPTPHAEEECDTRMAAI